jgi:protocatechuate 3,4-dioxygenase beta subunit
MFGYVGDTAYRPVAGATVEVVDRPLAGTRLTTDAGGRFSYTGGFPGAITFRAVKDGYRTATQRIIG